jgi:hypothetical protein
MISDIISNLQKLLAMIFALGVFILGGLIYFTDPFQNNLYLWAFLITVFVIVTTAFSLIGFWLAFNRKYVDMSSVKVVSIIRQSALAGSLISIILFLSAVNQLSLLNISILLLAYLMYELWSN